MPTLIKMNLNFHRRHIKYNPNLELKRQSQNQTFNLIKNKNRNSMQIKFQGNKTCSSCSGKK